MSYCCSTNCPRFTECERAFINAPVGETVYVEDHISFGSGTLIADKTPQINYRCGPEGDYQMFISKK